jgi:hypothetical protein
MRRSFEEDFDDDHPHCMILTVGSPSTPVKV